MKSGKKLLRAFGQAMFIWLFTAVVGAITSIPILYSPGALTLTGLRETIVIINWATILGGLFSIPVPIILTTLLFFTRNSSFSKRERIAFLSAMCFVLIALVVWAFELASGLLELNYSLLISVIYMLVCFGGIFVSERIFRKKVEN